MATGSFNFPREFRVVIFFSYVTRSRFVAAMRDFIPDNQFSFLQLGKLKFVIILIMLV